MRKKFFVKTCLLLIFTLFFDIGSSALVNADFLFDDVNESDWFYESVNLAADSGIINGNGDGTFDPYGELSISQTVTLASKIKAFFDDDIIEVNNDNSYVHWAQPYFDYAVKGGIIDEMDFSVSEYDISASRSEAFSVFASALPDEEHIIINNIDDAPEVVDNDDIKRLFETGVIIGSENGFEQEKSITRAETAAIVVRMIEREKRIKISEDNDDSSEPEADSETNISNEEYTYSPLLYSIPLTNWEKGDILTGKPNVKEGISGEVKTRFGNHSYGTSEQRKYNYVIEAIEDAYDHVAGKDSVAVKDPNSAYNRIRAGVMTQKYIENRLSYEIKKNTAVRKIFIEELKIDDTTFLSNLSRIFTVASEMSEYLRDEYVLLNKNTDIGGPDGINDDVYRYLARRGTLDDVGWANLQMAILDYLGLSTRMVGTDSGKCCGAQVLLCGKWICVELMNEDIALYPATAEELILYASTNGKEGAGEKDYLQGVKNNGAVYDLKIVQPATHLPDNYDYDAK